MQTAIRSQISPRQARWNFGVDRSIRSSGDVSPRMLMAFTELACAAAADHLRVDKEQLVEDDHEAVTLVRRNFVELVLGSDVVGLSAEQIAKHRAAGDSAVLGG